MCYHVKNIFHVCLIRDRRPIEYFKTYESFYPKKNIWHPCSIFHILFTKIFVSNIYIVEIECRIYFNLFLTLQLKRNLIYPKFCYMPTKHFIWIEIVNWKILSGILNKILFNAQLCTVSNRRYSNDKSVNKFCNEVMFL